MLSLFLLYMCELCLPEFWWQSFESVLSDFVYLLMVKLARVGGSASQALVVALASFYCWDLAKEKQDPLEMCRPATLLIVTS